MSSKLENQVENIVKEGGFDHVGFTRLKQPMSFSFYHSWLENQHHGEMSYLEKNEPIVEAPENHFEKAQSLIVVRKNYFPHPQKNEFPLQSLKVAHYAAGQDYHNWFRDELNQIIGQLQKVYPDEEFFAFTDAVPLLERDHAYQAGLGWIGKNTCLIDRQEGSLFFIGEILSSLSLAKESAETVPDHCGKCTACLDACPTDAFTEPRVMDATKCIAYWTIESRNVPPLEIRSQMGDWFFGCDICQTVCPWNIKLHKLKGNFNHDRESTESDRVEELRLVLQSSNKKLMKVFAGTPLTRAGGRGLKRNALIVAGNLKLNALIPEIKTYIDHPELGELAEWALSQMPLDLLS